MIIRLNRLMQPPMQPPLPLDFIPQGGAEHTMPLECQSQAWGVLNAPWPHNACLVVGDSGSGKSHMAAAWAQLRLAPVVHAPVTAEPAVAWGSAGALVVDTLSSDASAGDWLFHLLTHAANTGKKLLLVANSPPDGWPVKADVASRLAALPVAAITAPTDADLHQVFLKLASDEGLTPSPQACAFALARWPRTFKALNEGMRAASRLALAQRTGLTVGVLKQVGD
jgi:chromosomal replication initiation ATPase DnaA